MEEIVTEILLKGIAIPIITGLVVAGGVRFALGESLGARSAGAAIAIAFMVGYTLTLTWPDFPPRTSSQKLVYIALFGVAIGLAIDLLGAVQRLRTVLVIVAPGLIVGWLGWRVVSAFDVTAMLPHIVLWIGGAFVFFRLSKDDESSSTPMILILVSAIGAAAIAFFGASGSLAQLFGTLAAGTGAVLLWNWPTVRFPLGTAGLLGGGGVLISLVSAMVLFSEASKISVALLLLVFLSPMVVSRLPFHGQKVLGPIVLGLASSIPVVIGTLIAFLQAQESM